jgi:hypothetical protein
VRAGRARTGGVVLILLVLAACSFIVPAAAIAVPSAHAVRHGAVTVANGSTSVPPGAHKKAVKLSSVVWAVLAVAVLAAAVATPLALRRHRERAGPTRRNHED